LLILIIFIITIGAALDPVEQAALAEFYNSLTSRGGLFWNFDQDLCLNVKVACDYTEPRQVAVL